MTENDANMPIKCQMLVKLLLYVEIDDLDDESGE